MRKLFLPIALLCVSACVVEEIDFTGKSCAQDSDCPSGFICEAEACVRPDGSSADASTNGAPSIGNLRQFDPGGGELAPGSSVKQPPYFEAAALDPEGGEVRVEAELVSASAPFSGTPNFLGVWGRSGAASLSLDGLEPGAYRWQARAVDREGNASPFVAYNDGATAFTLLPQPIDGSLTIADGATWTREPDVTLRLQAISRTGATISQMEFSNDGEEWSGPEPFAPTRNAWTLSEGNGTKTVYARVIDSVGEWVVFEASIVLDSLGPELVATVGDGSGFTRQSPVQVTLEAIDRETGVAEIQFSYDDGKTFSEPEPFVSSWDWDLGTGDGEKSHYVRVTDRAGNSNELRIAVVLDTVPPEGLVRFAEGDWTSTVDVTLELVTKDLVATMAFSNDGASFGAPMPFAASHAYTLPPGDGPKSVTVRLADRAGNFEDFTASIGLDTEPPKLSEFLINGGADYANLPQVELTWNAVDELSGVQRVEARDGADVGSYSTSPALFPIQTEGLRTIELRVFDRAGNASVASQAVFFDSIAPSPPPSIQSRPLSRAAVLEFGESIELGSGLERYEMRVRSVVDPQPDWTSLGLDRTHELTGLQNDVDYAIDVRAVDRAGNVSLLVTTNVTPRFAFAFRHRRPAPVTWHGAAHVEHRKVVLVGEQGIIATSRDQFQPGSSEELWRDSGTDLTLRAVALDQNQANLVAVGDRGVITASRDEGMTWKVLENRGAGNGDLYAVAALYDSGTTPGFIAVGEGGAAVLGALSRIGSPPAPFMPITLPTTKNLRAVVSSPNQIGRIVVAGDDGTVLYTSDAGRTWNTASLPSGYGGMQLLAASFSNDDRMFYIGGVPPSPSSSPLLRSQDGKNWSPVPITSLNGRAIHAISPPSVAGNNASLVFLGRDLGGSQALLWRQESSLSVRNITPVSMSGRPNAVAIHGSSYATAAGEQGAVFTLSSSIGSFSEVANGRPVSLTALWAPKGNSSNAWLAGEGGYMAFSGDRGGRWEWVLVPGVQIRAISGTGVSEAIGVGEGGRIVRAGTFGVPQSMTSPVSVDLNDISCLANCYAVGRQGTILRQASSWVVALQEGGTAPDLLAVHTWRVGLTDRAIAVGESGAVRYLDGATFKPTTIAGAGRLVAVAGTETSSAEVLALDQNGAVYRTSDDGKTWTKIGSLDAGVKATDIAYSDRSRWFATTVDHGAYTSADGGVTWTKLRTDYLGAFSFVHSQSPTSTWIGGDHGALLHSTLLDAQ